MPPEFALARHPQLDLPGIAEPSPLLFTKPDWDFGTLRRIMDACGEIALGELGLDVYPMQLEVITSEQMLDAYASIGLPLMYRHWSFGKRFAYHEKLYKAGFQGLAYEIVINSKPCIVYIMEENSATMQTLVIAHAGYGHNHFFKNNYLFRQWTDAEGILDYLAFARDYVRNCVDKHGQAAVDRVLDGAHALQAHGVDRYKRNQPLSLAKERARREMRRAHQEASYNLLWSTVPGLPPETEEEDGDLEEMKPEELKLPEENILYFIEKKGPKLKLWERELIRIVRNVSQYFYPQKQLQLMNEGCATFVHYTIMNRLFQKGLITDGNMLEFLHSHSSVVWQPGFDDPRFGGINPYALGFAMMQDIKRMCMGKEETIKGLVPCTDEQLAEDRAWFPKVARNGDPYGTLRHAWANFRDESFVLQWLSPRVIRQFRLFELDDNNSSPKIRVEAIHNKEGYEKVREALSHQYDLSRREPDIQVVKADLKGDRTLHLEHYVHDGVLLQEVHCKGVIEHTAGLWGYPVELAEVDAASGKTLKTHKGEPPST